MRAMTHYRMYFFCAFKSATLLTTLAALVLLAPMALINYSPGKMAVISTMTCWIWLIWVVKYIRVNNANYRQRKKPANLTLKVIKNLIKDPLRADISDIV